MPRIRLASNQHRVLLYSTCYNVLDGVTLTMRMLENEILAAGYHVCVLTTKSGDPANTHLNGTHPNRRVLFLNNTMPIPFLHDPSQPDITYQIGFALSSSVLAELEDFEPSIIHITCTDCTALHLIRYARKKEIPLMGTYHSNIPEYMDHYPGLSWLKHILRALFRHQYNFMQAVYVPTPFIQRHLIETYKMDQITNLKVWGHGVDVDKFNPMNRSLKYRRDLGIGDQDVVIIWVSRLVPEKRPDIFCQTIRKLKALNVPFHALVAGAGAYEEEIKSLPNTTFLGWLNSDQLAVAYACSDIFLFPSAVETFGYVTLEAAASGLPVVVEEGCSGHLVRHGVNGFACAAEDENAFFEATLKLAQDEKMRRRFGENSRHLSLTMEKRSVVRKMLDNYSTVTDEFFTEYGGHHKNRDVVYTKPDSFTGGSIPRPLLLMLVEKLFLVLFNVIWNMASLFMYFQEAVLMGRPVAPLRSEVRGASPIRVGSSDPRPPIVSRSFSGSVNAEQENLVSVEFSVSSATASPSRSSHSRSAASSFSDENSMEVREEETEFIPLVDSASDEATNVTTREGSESCSCSALRWSDSQAFGDCPLSHILAKAFVRALEFQCRMESHLRNSCDAAYCLTGSVVRGAAFRGQAKRKNSGWDTSRLELTGSGLGTDSVVNRGRSDASDSVLVSVEDSIPTEVVLSAASGGRRLRRNQNSLNVV